MRYMGFGSRPLSLAALMLFALAGCRGSSGVPTPPVLPFANARGGQVGLQPLTSKIKHVVIVIQMERSFNNLFYGYPGAKTVSYGYNKKGQKIPLRPVSLATKWAFEGINAYTACNGIGKIRGTDCRMNGFDDRAYAYVPHSETKPYFDMAHQYALADEMFASNFDASTFGSLQYIIEGQDHGVVGEPSGLWGCAGGPDWIKRLGGGRIHPCFSSTTLASELDAKRLSWAYYAQAVNAPGGTYCGSEFSPDYGMQQKGIWSAYQAIKYICYGADWDEDVNPFSPPSKFLTNIASGELRDVTWITPTYQNSDQAGSDSATGPSWVTSLVNAVGESKYWDSTAIFILWDSYGGWYDPMPPKYLDNDGLGFRIPLLIISPYAKKGYVSHVHFEHGTILKFAEDVFGLPRLAISDRRANSPDDAFDFSKPPRAFVPIKTPLSADYFIHEPLDTRPPDTD